VGKPGLSAELLIGSLTRLPRQLWAYARLKRLSWLEQDRLVACRYPRDDTALRELAELGVTLLINLHERPHAPEALARHGERWRPYRTVASWYLWRTLEQK